MKREQSITNARGIAAIMVVIVHCTAQEFSTLFSGWLIVDVIASAVRPCVPIFFMISGYLLFDREVGTTTFIWKKTPRVLIPAIFWSILYVLFIALYNGRMPTISEFANALITPSMYHLWYLFFAVGIYLLLPMLLPWMRGSERKDRWVYFCIFMLCFIAAQTQVGSRIINEYYATIFVSYFFFFIVGAMFKVGDFYFLKRNKVVSIIGYIAFTSSIAILTYKSSYTSGSGSQEYFQYTNPLVIFQSILLFSLLTSLSFKNKYIDIISNYSLGVYGIHVAIIIIINPFILMSDNEFIRILASILLVIILSVFLSMVFAKIKLFRYII